MGIIVMKFGGEQVETTMGIKEIVSKVKRRMNEGKQVIVVVSSMGFVRQQLRQYMIEITDEPNKRERDALLATGAQMTSSLLAMALIEAQIPAISLNAWQAGVKTDAIHGHARIEQVQHERVQQCLEEGKVVVYAGHQGVTPIGDVTTFGKGGAELAAVALATKFQVEQVEIYTNVEGVYTADPNIVPKARKLEAVSYDEMLEFANLGAYIIHPRAVELAKKFSIPLVVRSNDQTLEGTVIKEEVQMEKNLVVRGVAYESDIVRLTVGCQHHTDGLLAPIFNALARHGINVDIIVQSVINGVNPTVSFTISKEEFAECLRVLEVSKASLGFSFADFEVGLAKVSIVGSGMVSNPGVAARMFDRLRKEQIEVKMVSTSEIKVSVVVKQDDMVRAANVLHDEFNLAV